MASQRDSNPYRDPQIHSYAGENLEKNWHQSWDREDTTDPDRMTPAQWTLLVLILLLLAFLVFMGIYWFILRRTA